MPSNASPWYRGRNFSEEWSGAVFVNLSPYYIRLSLRDLEAYKTRALWVSEADFTEAYDALCKQGAALLMDATDRIVREIRALRNGNTTPLADQDPALDPFALGLVHLARLENAYYGANGSLGQAFDRLIQLQEEANAGDEESLAELLKIAAIIVGV